MAEAQAIRSGRPIFLILRKPGVTGSYDYDVGYFTGRFRGHVERYFERAYLSTKDIGVDRILPSLGKVDWYHARAVILIVQDKKAVVYAHRETYANPDVGWRWFHDTMKRMAQEGKLPEKLRNASFLK
jgi:hypothetical protein